MFQLDKSFLATPHPSCPITRHGSSIIGHPEQSFGIYPSHVYSLKVISRLFSLVGDFVEDDYCRDKYAAQ